MPMEWRLARGEFTSSGTAVQDGASEQPSSHQSQSFNQFRCGTGRQEAKMVAKASPPSAYSNICPVKASDGLLACHKRSKHCDSANVSSSTANRLTRTVLMRHKNGPITTKNNFLAQHLGFVENSLPKCTSELVLVVIYIYFLISVKNKSVSKLLNTKFLRHK